MGEDDQRRGFRIEELYSDLSDEIKEIRFEMRKEITMVAGNMGSKNKGMKGGVRVWGNKKLSHFQTGHFLHL